MTSSSVRDNSQQPTRRSSRRAFHGAVIHSLSATNLEILPNALIITESDPDLENNIHKITHFIKDTTTTPPNLNLDDVETIHLPRTSKFLIPGFIDTHNHAPQWSMRGLGQGLHILDWLSQITFPHESKFADPSYARRVYGSCIDGFLKQGVTTASYYGSLHGDATKILADLCLSKGQRAYVGKCNMSRNSPEFYSDASVEDSLRVTEDVITHIQEKDPQGKLVKHILTPRFAISCHDDLLAGLGEISARNPEMPLQTHFNEAEQEMKFTAELFPQFQGSEADLYEHFGLLRKDRTTILAHCCHMTDYEMSRIKELGCGVAHCPVSNMTVGGGFMAAPVRAFLRRGIKVGLGTDSGGGFSSSMLDAMRQAMIASHAREVMSKGADEGLKIEEVFYLATLGGAEVCGLQDRIGNFEVGKEFDAVVVDTKPAGDGGIMTEVEEDDGLRVVFEKFVMTGDDRNIERVYVQGRQVK